MCVPPTSPIVFVASKVAIPGSLLRTSGCLNRDAEQTVAKPGDAYTIMAI
jgi:hypothetical protein